MRKNQALTTNQEKVNVSTRLRDSTSLLNNLLAPRNHQMLVIGASRSIVSEILVWYFRSHHIGSEAELMNGSHHTILMKELKLSKEEYQLTDERDLTKRSR
jgi:hypothetical protein